MVKNYAEEFRSDLAEFREKTKLFYEGKLSVPEYKGFSGGFGSYAQRGAKCGMLRLRLYGGRVTKDYLKFVIESIDKYHIDRVHLTTCQTIQLHNLSGETICSLIEEAWDHGIITRGGGGDFPRNVMMTPLAGVTPGEAFDVSPYAKEAADYLLSFIKAVKLPRKLKVCFSSTKENFPHATFRDLGFVACPDGTFDVYSAGGLGNNPKMGVKVAHSVAPEKILYYIKAMVDTFTAYGNYENRGRARTRYMQDTLGAEGYKKAYLEKLENVLKEENLDIEVTAPSINKQGDGNLNHNRAFHQKQDGLYAVSYHPIGGNPTPDMLHKILDAILPMKDVEIRLTPEEGMYFINCTAKEAETLIALTDDGAETLFESSVACIGNSICQVGARDSQSLLADCVKAVRPLNFADGVLPKIHISGCPSSCSAHQIGSIGFRGGVKQTPEGPKAAFAMYVNGSDIQGEERFGEDAGVLTVEDIPRFFVALGKEISGAKETFDTWYPKNKEKFMEIVGQFA